MQMKTPLLFALAALVAPLALTACGGPECGSGTTEKDGECVPNSTPTQVSCADGTTLESGECVLDASGCGTGTTLTDGKCVADGDPTDPAESCGAGTTYDSAAGKCVSSGEISCGANTMEVDGACVPDPAALCATGTMPNDDGVCVVGAAVCGENTILDPTTNTCLVNEADVFCGANTAYDDDSKTCVPTSDVCDAGTSFNADTGLCLSDVSCQAGDVIVNGVCVAPLQEAIANADLTSNEVDDRAANNDDTQLGGTAQALTLPAQGTEYVVTGQINTPVDVDGDGTLDQDIDVYSFTATAGQTFKLAVQPTDGAPLTFLVSSDSGSYARYSPLGMGNNAARQIVIPADGTYEVIVAPSAVFLGNDGLVGDDAWTYALTIEEIAPFTATDVDTTTGSLAGDVMTLSDNLFKLTNFTTGGFVEISVDTLGEDLFNGALQIWGDPTMTHSVYSGFEEGDAFLVQIPAGEAYVLVDAFAVLGVRSDFDISVEARASEVEPNDDLATATPISVPGSVLGTGGFVDGGQPAEAAADVPYDYYTFTLADDLATTSEQLVARLDMLGNPASEDTLFALFDSTGAELGRATAADGYSIYTSSTLTAGTYTIGVYNAAPTTDDTFYQLSLELRPAPVTLDGTVGDTCATAIPVNMSGIYAGSLDDFTSTFDPDGLAACTVDTSGLFAGEDGGANSEVFFAVPLLVNETLTANVDSAKDTVLYIVGDCTMEDACLVRNDTTGAEMVDYTATADTTVYVVVDLYSDDPVTGATFELQIDVQ